MYSQRELDRLFAAIDAKDAEAFASFIREDGRFVYGSLMDVVGREAIEQAVAGFFSTLTSLSHANIQAWDGGDGRTQFVYGEVHYVLPNGRYVDAAFLNRFVFDGKLVAHYHVFTDPTPLIQAAQGE